MTRAKRSPAAATHYGRYARPDAGDRGPPRQWQDRDGAEALLRQTRRSFPFIEVIFADGGYQGDMAAVTAKTGKWRLEIVKRNDIPRFEVLPKRWIVETNPGLDQPLPPIGPRLRAPCSNCRRLRLSCYDPAHAPPPHSKPLSLIQTFRNGL